MRKNKKQKYNIFLDKGTKDLIFDSSQFCEIPKTLIIVLQTGQIHYIWKDGKKTDQIKEVSFDCFENEKGNMLGRIYFIDKIDDLVEKIDFSTLETKEKIHICDYGIYPRFSGTSCVGVKLVVTEFEWLPNYVDHI